MREVVAGKEAVGVHRAQVLDLQLDERAGQLGRVTQLAGEAVRLELVAARKDVLEQRDGHIHGRQRVGEEDEADDDGVLVDEAEVGVEGVVVDEDGEQGEDVEEVDLSGSLASLE